MPDQLTYHTRYSTEALNAQYNLAARRPDYIETVIPKWASDSAHVRESIESRLDVRYGAGERQRLDVFRCQADSAPTLIYFHGGYWRSGDKSIYSFIAPAFVEREINVVVVGYDLCPDVTVTRIVEEAREAMVYLWHNAPHLGLDRERLSIMGHSAGGHIALMLMATDWQVLDFGMPSSVIRQAYPVSPLSLLEPVRLTPALNESIRLDECEARAMSPLVHHAPTSSADQLIFVGAQESEEFHRQATMYAEKFCTTQRRIEVSLVPRADHFDVLNALVDPKRPYAQSVISQLHDMDPRVAK